MTQLTVKALSDEIGTPVDRLIEQLADAGIKKASSDNVTDEEKQQLLSHLKKNTVISLAIQSLLALRYSVKLVVHLV